MKQRINDMDHEQNDQSLQQVVQLVLTRCQDKATIQNSVFINQINPTLHIAADKGHVSTLLGHLFSMISNYCRDTVIKITAKAYHNIVVMHIKKDTNPTTHQSMLSALQNMKTDAGKIGGFLEITSQRRKETTIAFSFVNQAVQPNGID